MKKKRHFNKRWLILPAAVVVIGIGAYIAFRPDQEAMASASYTEEAASRQDIAVTLSSTGTLQPANQYTVTAAVKGEVLSATFEEGDTVEQGEILYEIDKSDIQNTIDRAALSLQQSQKSYQETLENLDNLTVTAENTGTIIELYVSEGDQVQTGATIADLRNSDVMEITLPFNSADADSFYIGQSATLTMDGSFETLTGSVTAIDGAETVLDGYQIIKNVTIQVKNPGGLSESSAATAVINGVACNQGANFTYSSSETIVAEVAGKIASLNVREGSTVSKGATIATLSSTSIQNQVENGKLSLEDAELSYQNTVDQMDDYTITAPISGTVVTKNVKVGDTLDNTSGQAELAVIYDLSYLTFDISLDELDVNQVEVGQTVNITCDALENVELQGYVTKVSVAGTTSNGVTTYPVTVQIDNPPAELLPGMNVDATIVVDSAEQALSVPTAAVQRGNTVYVKDSSAVNEQGIMVGGVTLPDGWKAVEVETGLSDDNYVEIISGLTEGDVVFVPETSREATEMGMDVMGGNMGGAMGGGTPPDGGGNMGGGPGGGGMP